MAQNSLSVLSSRVEMVQDLVEFDFWGFGFKDRGGWPLRVGRVQLPHPLGEQNAGWKLKRKDNNLFNNN